MIYGQKSLMCQLCSLKRFSHKFSTATQSNSCCPFPSPFQHFSQISQWLRRVKSINCLILDNRGVLCQYSAVYCVILKLKKNEVFSHNLEYFMLLYTSTKTYCPLGNLPSTSILKHIIGPRLFLSLIHLDFYHPFKYR